MDVKMHLFRHTVAGGMREVDPRTALLKAITADYCGDGVGTWTTPGHALAFGIADGAISVPSPHVAGTVEAIWGPGGAVCIDTPRLRSLSEINGPPSPPGCGRPHPFDPCSRVAPGPLTPTSWTSVGHAVTVNP
jgi:ADYC domain-containing protein